jgi:hypothetical protein
MRRFLLPIVFASAVIGSILVAGWYFNRPTIALQLAGHRIAQAKSFAEAKREIAAIEQQTDHEEALRELVSRWGSGSAMFDFYLAAYLSSWQSSEDLRRLFSLELSWRRERLEEWAHFWTWHTRQSPADEVASIADYLAALSSADPPRQLTWREVLDLQAAMALTGDADSAVRLSPDNWADRYRAWHDRAPDYSRIHRSEKPLPNWQGAAPTLPDEQ